MSIKLHSIMHVSIQKTKQLPGFRMEKRTKTVVLKPVTILNDGGKSGVASWNKISM